MAPIVLDTWHRFTHPNGTHFVHLPASLPAPYAADLTVVRGWGVQVGNLGWQVFTDELQAQAVAQLASR